MSMKKERCMLCNCRELQVVPKVGFVGITEEANMVLFQRSLLYNIVPLDPLKEENKTELNSLIPY